MAPDRWPVRPRGGGRGPVAPPCRSRPTWSRAATTAEDLDALAPPVPAESARRGGDGGQRPGPGPGGVAGPGGPAAEGHPARGARGARRWAAVLGVQRRGVAYLATHAGGVGIERYASDLWPEDPPWCEHTRVKSKVRTSISQVRKLLGINPRTGTDYLPRNAGAPGAAYRLDGDVLVDADLFRRLRVRGLARGADGITDLWAALDLVHGPAVPRPPARRVRVAGRGAAGPRVHRADRGPGARAGHPPPGRRGTGAGGGRGAGRAAGRQQRGRPAAGPGRGLPGAGSGRAGRGLHQADPGQPRRRGRGGPAAPHLPRSCAAAAGCHRPRDRARLVAGRGRWPPRSRSARCWRPGRAALAGRRRTTVVAAPAGPRGPVGGGGARSPLALVAVAGAGDPGGGVVAVRRRRCGARRRGRADPSAARPVRVPAGRRGRHGVDRGGGAGRRVRGVLRRRGRRRGGRQRLPGDPVLSPPAMGLGDVRLAAVTGGLLGWHRLDRRVAGAAADRAARRGHRGRRPRRPRVRPAR